MYNANMKAIFYNTSTNLRVNLWCYTTVSFHIIHIMVYIEDEKSERCNGTRAGNITGLVGIFWWRSSLDRELPGRYGTSVAEQDDLIWREEDTNRRRMRSSSEGDDGQKHTRAVDWQTIREGLKHTRRQHGRYTREGHNSESVIMIDRVQATRGY